MNEQTKAALYAFLGGLIWSFSGLFSKMVTWSSFSLAGLRAMVAVVILAIGRGGIRLRLNRGLWLSAAGISLTSVLYMCALKYTTSANAVVLQYTASVFVILYLLLIRRQKPLKSELVAAVFVILGVCLCFAGGLGGGRLLGNVLGLFSGLTYSLVFISTRYSGNDPLDGVYFGQLISCVFALAVPFDSGFSFTWPNLAIMLALGCALGVGYYFFSLSMRHGISAVRSCVISNVEPVMNPVWVYLFRGENPGIFSILGAAVVLLSVTLQSLYESLRAKK